MSSSSQTLTSTFTELYDLLKNIHESSDSLLNEPTVKTSVSQTGESIEGRYKYEVHDKTGLVYDSGDWQPNLILNCGLDKLSEMPIAQVFQFAVAGTDPTLTKESHEQSNLTVKLLSSSKCPPANWTGTECDPKRPGGALIARACEGNLRIAPDHALGGTCEQKAFDASHDLGKLLYLRELDLQYNVVSSCPVYTEDPQTPDIGITAGCDGSLSAAIIPGGAPTNPPVNGSGVWVGKGGAGYMASLSHDTGGPWNIPGNLILKRQNFDLPMGNCQSPLLCTYTVSANHTLNKDEWEAIKGGKYVNPGVGISIGAPNMLRPDVVATPTGCELQASDITINDKGRGLPIYDASIPGCKPLEIVFNPSSNGSACRSADWTSRPAATQFQFSEDADWKCQVGKHAGRGETNHFNLIRIGQQQTGEFTHPDIMANLPDTLKSKNATSFEHFFSQLWMFEHHRKSASGWVDNQPVGVNGNVTLQGEYEKLHHDFSQRAGDIPGMFGCGGYPVGHPTCPSGGGCGLGGDKISEDSAKNFWGNWGRIANHTGASKDDTNSFEDFRPQRYLPYWIKNNIADMDTGSGAAGGATYVEKFAGVFAGNWANFKSSILDNKCSPVTPDTSWTDAAYDGNLFSGIPIGAFKDLPDYEWIIDDSTVSTGCGIKTITPVVMSGIFACFGNQSGNAFSGSAMSRPTSNLSNPHFANLLFNIAEFNIVAGKLESIIFKWSNVYKTLAHVGQSGHIANVMNDRTLLFNLRTQGGSITYESPRGARGTVNVEQSSGEIIDIDITDPGVGYCVGDTNIRGTLDLPPARQATLSATTTDAGQIENLFVIDPGQGYSSVDPAKICFPPPPEPEIISYDLVLDAVDTYDSINQGHWHTKVKLPTARCYKADIFETQQTYLFNQYKTHGWYLTGASEKNNTTHCGTDFLSAANQVAMTRTFDFYMELQPVTYTEIGLKESPAACELWSRIALDPPIKLCPGQFLRVAYQLVITFEPGPVPRYKEVPSSPVWYNRIDPQGNYLLSGYECIQGLGMAVVDQLGIAVPYDITGLANEPYAPGSTNLGPQYGFVNRWHNGDLRLSWPTKEYLVDADNPWIHGGDQMNPPDWAAKYKNSPTVNYFPRTFNTYIENPAHMSTIPNVNNSSPNLTTMPIVVPAGPELTLERDAFDHWFTKAPPEAERSITFTNFTPTELGGNGRWDFLVTKDYVADIYPNLLDDPHVHHDNVRDDKWILMHKDGQPLPDGSPIARSSPGVFPGAVIQYTGQPGALHDPISVKGGKLTRNVSEIIYPYCDTHHIVFLEPNNTGTVAWPEIEWEISYCAVGQTQKKKWKSLEWCPTDSAPYTNNMIDRTWGLTQRKNYYGFGSLINKNPVDEKAGGGFTRIESWSPWTHMPLLTSIDQWNLTGPDRMPLKPDTAGNWSAAEAIPVAGASGFVSTIGDDFAEYGNWVNRSHTIKGAVSGANRRPEHDYTRGVSFEVPTYLEPYTFSDVVAGDHHVKKHAIFETSFANLTGIKCIGLGPTSTTLEPPNMTDAPRFNTYVFKFGDVITDVNYKGMDKLIAYKLDVTFSHTFYRNLKT